MAMAQISYVHKHKDQARALVNTSILFSNLVEGTIGDIEQALRRSGNDEMNIHTFHHIQLNIDDDAHVYSIAVTVDYTIGGGKSQTTTIHFYVDQDDNILSDFS